ncbi:MAG: hypothetical protein M1834_004410 [Cirrosporium novae-zelandiae]|nr:MAG: hypothetical protein M1834_004410 [Cirrosporium novae-zelandiae]
MAAKNQGFIVSSLWSFKPEAERQVLNEFSTYSQNGIANFSYNQNSDCFIVENCQANDERPLDALLSTVASFIKRERDGGNDPKNVKIERVDKEVNQHLQLSLGFQLNKLDNLVHNPNGAPENQELGSVSAGENQSQQFSLALPQFRRTWQASREFHEIFPQFTQAYLTSIGGQTNSELSVDEPQFQIGIQGHQENDVEEALKRLQNLAWTFFTAFHPMSKHLLDVDAKITRKIGLYFTTLQEEGERTLRGTLLPDTHIDLKDSIHKMKMTRLSLFNPVVNKYERILLDIHPLHNKSSSEVAQQVFNGWRWAEIGDETLDPGVLKNTSVYLFEESQYGQNMTNFGRKNILDWVGNTEEPEEPERKMSTTSSLSYTGVIAVSPLDQVGVVETPAQEPPHRIRPGKRRIKKGGDTKPSHLQTKSELTKQKTSSEPDSVNLKISLQRSDGAVTNDLVSLIGAGSSTSHSVNIPRVIDENNDKETFKEDEGTTGGPHVQFPLDLDFFEKRLETSQATARKGIAGDHTTQSLEQRKENYETKYEGALIPIGVPPPSTTGVSESSKSVSARNSVWESEHSFTPRYYSYQDSLARDQQNSWANQSVHLDHQHGSGTLVEIGAGRPQKIGQKARSGPRSEKQLINNLAFRRSNQTQQPQSQQNIIGQNFIKSVKENDKSKETRLQPLIDLRPPLPPTPWKPVNPNLRGDLTDLSEYPALPIPTPAQPQTRPSSSISTLRITDETKTRNFKKTMGQQSPPPMDIEIFDNHVLGDKSPVGFEGKDQKYTGNLLEIARRCAGQIRLNVQIGRIVIPRLAHTEHDQYDIAEWHKIFDNSHGAQPPDIHFLPALTSSGQDVDFITLLKLDDGKPMFKSIREYDVIYCFKCKTPEGTIMEIEIAEPPEAEDTDEPSEKPRYTVSQPITMGTISRHFPRHSWDAAMTLKCYDLNARLDRFSQPAKELADHLRVPPGKENVELSTKNSFLDLRVESVLVRRRCSYEHHQHSDIILNITEVQVLNVQRLEENQAILRAISCNIPTMIRDHDRWYEVSLTSQFIDEVFDENMELGIGEIASWTPDMILNNTEQSVPSLWSVTRTLVHAIDNVGFHNKGPSTAPPLGNKLQIWSKEHHGYTTPYFW